MIKNIGWWLPASAILALVSFLTCSNKPENSDKSSLLWKVSGNGLQSPSYIFGTIHIIEEKDYFFPNKYEKALKSCKKLVMEIDLADIMGQLNLMVKVQMDSGKTLQDMYSEEDYAFILKTAKDSFDTDIRLFQSMKPLFIQQNLLIKNIVGKNTKSYEMELLGKAQKLGLSTAGLETAEEQITIIDNISLEEQAQMLLESMKNINEDRVNLLKMIQYYKDQNVDSLYTIAMSKEDMKEHEENLLGNRNRKWIPMIEKMVKEEPSFIAVGAAHLGGPEGVLELLRKQGYTVTPVH